MNEASWERLADAIDLKFGITDHGHFQRPLEDRPDLSEKVEYIQFIKGGEDMRLERITKPAIKERKVFRGRSASAGGHIQNIYEEGETTSHVEFFKRVGEDWQPIDAEELSLG